MQVEVVLANKQHVLSILAMPAINSMLDKFGLTGTNSQRKHLYPKPAETSIQYVYLWNRHSKTYTTTQIKMSDSPVSSSYQYYLWYVQHDAAYASAKHIGMHLFVCSDQYMQRTWQVVAEAKKRTGSNSVRRFHPKSPERPALSIEYSRAASLNVSAPMLIFSRISIAFPDKIARGIVCTSMHLQTCLTDEIHIFICEPQNHEATQTLTNFSNEAEWKKHTLEILHDSHM